MKTLTNLGVLLLFATASLVGCGGQAPQNEAANPSSMDDETSNTEVT